MIDVTQPDASSHPIRIFSSSPDAIRISPRHSRYFETPDGKFWIPVGLNLCFPRFDPSPARGLARYERWFDALASNSGNFARLWLGHPFFDIEPVRAGEFDEAAARRLDAVLDMAGKRGIRIKITLEHFRTISPRQDAEIFPGAASFSKPIYARANGGYADDMAHFLDAPACRRRYLKKLDWLARRYSTHPTIFGWELWNEMTAVSAPAENWLEWTHVMLHELRRRFPRHLAMQSLGSCDAEAVLACYRRYTQIPGFDLYQVHRYMDPGAELAVCHGAMDRLCSDAVAELLGMTSGCPRPVLLAECGAVESRHSAPSRLYEHDTEGVLLHDQLFAPFFSGAAGPGQAWHWDFYVERHNLWWHFARFAKAINGFDPVGERAIPSGWQTGDLCVYALSGRWSTLLWLRDSACGAGREGSAGLVRHQPPALLAGRHLALAKNLKTVSRAHYFDPWTNATGECPVADETVFLPPFRRSLVLRLCHENA
jgi:hypothetical protein